MYVSSMNIDNSIVYWAVPPESRFGGWSPGVQPDRQKYTTVYLRN